MSGIEIGVGAVLQYAYYACTPYAIFAGDLVQHSNETSTEVPATGESPEP